MSDVTRSYELDIAQAVADTIEWRHEKSNGRLHVWPEEVEVTVECHRDAEMLPVYVTGTARIEAGLLDDVRWRACLVGVRWMSGDRLHASYEVEVCQ